MEGSGAYFDAVYKVHKLQENRLLVNYKQVFIDFEIPKERIKDQVMIISSIGLEN